MGEQTPPGAKTEGPTYSVVARRLHWWTVLLLATQVPLGLVPEADAVDRQYGVEGFGERRDLDAWDLAVTVGR